LDGEIVVNDHDLPSISLALARYNEQKKLIYLGKVGTGFSALDIKELHTILSKIKITKPPMHINLNDKIDRNMQWVKPLKIAEIRYFEITKAHKLRMPVFLRIRKDKKIEECVLES